MFFAGSQGCNRLISEGAQPLTCPEDLEQALAARGLCRSRAGVVEEAEGGRREGADPVLDAVLAGPAPPDEIAAALGMSAVDCIRALVALERAGLAARYPDGSYGPPRRTAERRATR